MKRILAFTSALCLAGALLAGCSKTDGDTDTTSALEFGSPEAVAGVSTPPASESTAPEAPEASSAPAEPDAAGEEAADLSGTLNTLAAAAELGTTIEVGEIDLKAGGLPTDSIVAFAAAESNLASENGGTVMVFQVQPGTEQQMLDALAAWRDTRANDDRYADFATARENTAGARIVEKNGLIIYAVSASGSWDALDSALEAV